ncbi:MAG TPA: SDR family oxidoreductase [Puia sp.]|nr:SDR family oxidoreductase [Puia sp.]
MAKGLFDLSGKWALVTGCNKGIGKAMAIGLAEAGADIIGVSASLAARDSEVEKEVISVGRKFRAYQCDFSSRDALYAFIKQLEKDQVAIDILLNNAGMINRKPVAEYPDEYWDEIISVNLDAPFILAREVGRQMLKRGKGKIIFTCSLLSFQGGIRVPGYAATKGALSSLVKAMANEWAHADVCVNGIAPGYIATDNTVMLRSDEQRNKAILDRIPAQRWGDPEDLKGAAVFLSSAASDYVHGTILTVDGGWMGR